MRQLDAMVWIEDAASRIARGHADAVTREGLHAQGDEVAVRIAPERGAKTLATTARVDSVQGAAGDVECSLVWSAPADERRELDAWLSKAA
jgi:hypothetical protein